MTKWGRGVCLSFLCGGAILFFAGCEGVAYTEAGPGGVYYGYDYYPDVDVYYYPGGHTYYWYDDGDWHSGDRLPSGYDIQGEPYERLHLRGREPWLEHHPEHREFEGHYEHQERRGHQEREEHREGEHREDQHEHGSGPYHYHHD